MTTGGVPPAEGTAGFYRGHAALFLAGLPDAPGDEARIAALASMLEAAFSRGAASRASPEAPEWNGDAVSAINLLRAFRDSVRFVRTRAERESLAAHAEAVLLIQKSTPPIESLAAKWPDPAPCAGCAKLREDLERVQHAFGLAGRIATDKINALRGLLRAQAKLLREQGYRLDARALETSTAAALRSPPAPSAKIECHRCLHDFVPEPAPAPTEETREEHFGPEGGRLITVGEQIAAGCAHVSGGACMACVRTALAAERSAFATHPPSPPPEDSGARCPDCGGAWGNFGHSHPPASSKEGGRHE